LGFKLSKNVRLRPPSLHLTKKYLDGLLGMTALTGIVFEQEAHMPRTFAYVRVSTIGQTTENQVQEITAAGFAVEPQRVVADKVSGSSALEQRPGFKRLLDKLERDDVLIVTKLDRLGRSAIDVSSTV